MRPAYLFKHLLHAVGVLGRRNGASSTIRVCTESDVYRVRHVWPTSDFECVVVSALRVVGDSILVDDSAFVDHQNPISMADGTEPAGDDEYRPASTDRAHILLNDALALLAGGG